MFPDVNPAILPRVARRTVLTHMGPAMDYRSLLRRLPPGIEPAHDGMVLEVPPG